METILEKGFSAGMTKHNVNPYLEKSEEFYLWDRGYRKGLDYAPPIVSFSMERNSDLVNIYYNDNKIDEIKVFAFAKVIAEHTFLSTRKVSNENYFKLCKLWGSVSEELASEYRNRIDYDKLNILDQIVLAAIGMR